MLPFFLVRRHASGVLNRCNHRMIKMNYFSAIYQLLNNMPQSCPDGKQAEARKFFQTNWYQGKITGHGITERQ